MVLPVTGCIFFNLDYYYFSAMRTQVTYAVNYLANVVQL
jgi:hypothetical protein